MIAHYQQGVGDGCCCNIDRNCAKGKDQDVCTARIDCDCDDSARNKAGWRRSKVDRERVPLALLIALHRGHRWLNAGVTQEGSSLCFSDRVLIIFRRKAHSLLVQTIIDYVVKYCTIQCTKARNSYRSSCNTSNSIAS